VNRDERTVELGRIAHDLSNLLAAIRSFATVIGEDHHDDPVVRADLDQILRAVDEGVLLAKRLSEMGELPRPAK
jgi:signal transduction histidine kinase